MRISVFDNDSGEWPLIDLRQKAGDTKRIAVFLDGIEIDHIQTADEEDGFILKDKLNENGELFTVEVNGEDEWAVEELRGKVEIKLLPLGDRLD